MGGDTCNDVMTHGRAETLSPLARRSMEVAELGGSLVAFAGAAPVPAKPVVLSWPDESGWLVLDARLDPQVAKGTFAIPAGPRRRLRRIARTGVQFDSLFIAHELAPGTTAGLRPDDLSKPDVLKRLAGPPSREKTAEKVVGITTLALGAMASAGMAALSVLDDLDPAIFGIVTASGIPEPGNLAAWFLLAYWS